MDSELTRRDDEGDGLDTSPWWVKAVVRIGVPSAIACVLVWFLMNSVTSSLAAIRADVQAQKVTMETTAASLTRQESANGELLSYMRMICVNTSKNDSDRSSCLKAGR